MYFSKYYFAIFNLCNLIYCFFILKDSKTYYVYTKEIFKIQKKQVETATYNFNRSQAQYKLGSITAIEFRQAQINLTNAQNQRTIAKYQAKLAELQLIQITGKLLNIKL